MKKIENNVAPAKTWTQPELKRLDAGSAENGPRNELPDGTLNQFAS